MKSQDLLKRFTALTASLILTFSAVDPAAVMAAENEQGTESTGNEESGKDTQLDITVTDITQTADADDSTKINVSFKVGGADAEKVNQITIAEKGTGTSAENISYDGDAKSVSASLAAGKTYEVSAVVGEQSKALCEITADDSTVPVIETVTGEAQSWSAGPVKVTVTANDAAGNLKGLFYSTKSDLTKDNIETEGRAVENGKECVIDGEQGVQTENVYFYALDSAGNISAAKAVKVMIDKQAPSLTVSVKPEDMTAENAVKAEKVTITAEAADTGSGIDAVYYSDKKLDSKDVLTNGEKLEDGSKEITVEKGKSDKGTRYIYAADKAGNITEQAVNVNVDNEAAIEVEARGFEGKSRIAANCEKLTFDVKSSNEDEPELYVSENKEITEENAKTSGTKITDGVYELTCEDKQRVEKTLYFYAVDKLGNVSELIEKQVVIDRDPPVIDTVSGVPEEIVSKDTELTVSLVNTNKQNVTYYYSTEELSIDDYEEKALGSSETGSDKLTVSCKDDEEAIDQTYYIYALDEAGNLSEPKEVTFSIDKKGPEVTLTADRPSNEWGNTDITVKAEANATGAPLKAMYRAEYESNDPAVRNEEWLEANAHKLEDGEHIITADDGDVLEKRFEYYALDEAGNVSYASYDARIDKSIPVITKLVSDSSEEEFTGEKVTVTVEASDAAGDENCSIYYGTENLTGDELTAEKVKTLNKVNGNTAVIECENGKIIDEDYYFYAVDGAGNVSKATAGADGRYNNAVRIKIEKTAPKVVLTSSAEGWTLEDVLITADAADEHSDIEAVYYSDGEKLTGDSLTAENVRKLEIAEAVEGKENSFSLKVSCDDDSVVDKQYYFYAIDKCGNVSEAEMSHVTIDKKAPVISMVSVTKYEGAENEEALSSEQGLASLLHYDDTGVTPVIERYLGNTTIQISVKADDEGSGISLDKLPGEKNDKLILIAFKEGSREDILKTYELEKKGDSYVCKLNAQDLAEPGEDNKRAAYTIAAYDALGNLTYSEHNYDFIINEANSNPPTVELVEGTESFNEGVYSVQLNAVTGEVSELPEGFVEGYKIAAVYAVNVDPESKEPVTSSSVYKNGVKLPDAAKLTFKQEGKGKKDELGGCVAIVAIDTLGNLSAPVLVSADKQKPVLSGDIDAPEGWSNKPVTVTVTGLADGDKQGNELLSTGLDAQSVYCEKKTGESTADTVKAVRDSKDSGKYVFTFDKDTSGIYTFYAKDAAGNETVIGTREIKVDMTKPEIGEVKYKVEGKKGDDGEWVSGSVDVTVSPKDLAPEGSKTAEPSGIKRVWYEDTDEEGNKTETEGAYDEKTGSYHFKVSGDQDREYTIFTEDNAGNTDKASILIKIDITAPEITKLTNSSEGEWTNENVTVTVTAADPEGATKSTAGIKNVYCEVNDAYDNHDAKVIEGVKGEGDTYTFTFTEDQNASYTFYAIDNASNVSLITKSTAVKKDTVSPKITKVEYADNGKWVNKDKAKVYVTVEDPDDNKTGAVSGVSKVWCEPLDGSINADEEPDVTYDEATKRYVFTFKNEQNAVYAFHAEDNAGNLSKEDISSSIRIDRTLPKVTEISNDSEEKWTNGRVKVKIKAEDPAAELSAKDKGEVYSQLAEVWYVPAKDSKNPENSSSESARHIYIDNGQEKIKGVKYTAPSADGSYEFTFDNEQDAEYVFYAKDTAGNVSEITQRTAVRIDKVSPVISAVSNSYEDTWTNKTKVDVTVKVNDPDKNHIGSVSKIKEVYFVEQGRGAEQAQKHRIKAADGEETASGEYTFSFTSEQEAEYTFYAVDTAGNVTAVGDTKKSAVKIDRTAPEFGDSSFAKINAYKFGNFLNEEITVAVAANDPKKNGTSSNIKSAVMKAGGITVTKTSADLVDGVWQFKVPYDRFVADKLYKSVVFELTDEAGNKTTKNLGELTKKSSSDLLDDTVAPQIDAFSFPGAVYTDGAKRWFNRNDITAKASFKDLTANGKDASGIRSTRISTASQSTPYSIDKNAASARYSVTQNVTSVKGDIADNGELVFTASMTDIAGNTYSRKESVYVDTKAPAVTGISVINSNGTQNIAGSSNEYHIEAFDNKNVTVRIDAADTAGKNTGASLVDTVTYILHDINGNELDSKTLKVTAGSGGSSYAQFVISPDFKGYITAYAVDNVGNVSSVVTTKRIVVESASRHSRSSDISIKLPAPDATLGGENLYNHDIDVVIDFADSYSGIKTVAYELTYHGGKNDPTQKLTTVSSDSNIVTAAQQTLHITNNSNNIELHVFLTDNAGNTSEKTVRFSIDKTVPTIDVSYNNNNYNSAYNETEYYKADRKATITITERNFDKGDVVAAIEASTGNAPRISDFVTTEDRDDPDKTKHTATVTFSEDADYTFALDYTDLAGNKAAKYKANDFTLDKTAPVVESIELSSSPQNEKYYAKTQTVTVTVREHNFDSSLVSLTSSKGEYPLENTWNWSKGDGDIHVATFTLDNDDVYEFSIGLDDKAANSSAIKDQSEFVIDTTKPGVSINGVEKDTAYGFGREVAPDIYGKDLNLDRVEFTLTKYNKDGSVDKDYVKNFTISDIKSSDGDLAEITRRGINFAQTEEMDGIYTLTATSYDLAGNSQSTEATFSVNRFGANFTVDDDETLNNVIDKYLKQEQDVVIKAINVNPIEEETITISVNGEIKTLTRGTDYTVNEIEREGWHEYEYIIDKSVFADDGYYTVSVSAEDEAGNISVSSDDAHEENAGEISFFIDKIKPEVVITGADEGQSYEESSKEITVKFEDKNLDTDSPEDYIHIKVNGKELSADKYTIDSEETGSGVITVRFTVDENDVDIEAYITDLAGNESDKATLSFKLSQNFIQRLYNNHKGAFFGAIGGIAAVIAGIVILIVKKKKR